MPKVIEINGLPSMQLSGKMGSRYTRMKLEMLRDAVAMLSEPPPAAQLSRLASAVACVGSNFAIRRFGSSVICPRPFVGTSFEFYSPMFNPS